MLEKNLRRIARAEGFKNQDDIYDGFEPNYRDFNAEEDVIKESDVPRMYDATATAEALFGSYAISVVTSE